MFLVASCCLSFQWFCQALVEPGSGSRGTGGIFVVDTFSFDSYEA